MLLFSKNDNKSKKEEDALYVFSLSTSLAEELVSELRLAGMTKVSGIDTDVLASGAFQTPDDMKGAIIDVGSRTDVDNIVQSLQIKLPGGVWFCLVGNSDSISLAQQFADYNISYFNSSAQKGLIVQAAVSDKSEHSTRKKNAISIAVLGCKGVLEIRYWPIILQTISLMNATHRPYLSLVTEGLKIWILFLAKKCCRNLRR
ncbi:hypothetical protein QNH14_21925 [Apirhabdus apintestini]|nr:hypothetical protein QNH14_21925 [Enterobacteriaceae bacterium CA-0114]